MSAAKPKVDRTNLAWDLSHRYRSFPSLQDALSWINTIEKQDVVEFSRKELRPSPNPEYAWTGKHIYVCGRTKTGGTKLYQKKHPDTERKIDTKKIAGGCPSRITIKEYKGTSTVAILDESSSHSHEIGTDNVKFTRVPTDTKEKITRLLRLGVDPMKVVCYLTCSARLMN